MDCGDEDVSYLFFRNSQRINWTKICSLNLDRRLGDSCLDRGRLFEMASQRVGNPAIVKAATDDYRAESDPLRDFLDEWCSFGPGTSVAVGALFVAYRN
jgi:hypothetical protein